MKQLTIEQKAKAYDEAIKRAREYDFSLTGVCVGDIIEDISPELKESESEDEKIRKALIRFHKSTIDIDGIKGNEIIAWLEKRGESELPKDLGEYIAELSKQFPEVSFAKLSRIAVKVKNWLEKQVPINEEAEKEKNDYVSGQFLYCKGSFNEFKEGESYWIEYIGNDTYIGRSDNILNQKFHITPRQLYTWFDPRHPEKQGEQKQEANYPKFDFNDILALQCCMETVKKVQEDKELYGQLQSLHDRLYDAYRLEKQGEKGTNGNEREISNSEQNPADKVEPKFKVKYANSEYNVLEIKEIAGVTYYGIEDEPNHIDYVLPDNCEIINGYAIKENGCPYPTKPAVFSEQKPAETEKGVKRNDREIPFSEKEPYEGLTDFERTLADICIGWIGEELGWKQYIKDNADALLKIAIKKFNSVQDAIFEKKPAEFDDTNAKRMFIKALERVEEQNNKGYKLTDCDKNSWWEDFKAYTSCTIEQKPAAWSDEDEKQARQIERIVHDDGCTQKLQKQIADWFKSLKDRYTWKPSDEQMNALNYVVNLMASSERPTENDLYYNILKSLRQQLMKLKA